MSRRSLKIALATVTPALVTGGIALAAAGGPSGGHTQSAHGARARRGGPLLAMRHPLRSRLTSADIRLEVGGQLRDFRLDHGTVQSISSTQVVLHELDGAQVAVPVDAGTHVRNDRRRATLADIKPGEVAFTLRMGDGPARQLRAGQPAPNGRSAAH